MSSLQVATTGTVSGLQNNQQINTIANNLATLSQSGSAPTTTSTGLAALAGLFWHDTGANAIKIRDQADANWPKALIIDETNKLIYPANGLPPQGSFKNLKVTVGDNTHFTITADEVMVEDSSGNSLRLGSVNVTINLGASGAANQLDTGTQAASTWYSGWVIFNPLLGGSGTVAGLASTSSISPTMPSGYTHKARLCWVRSDGATHLWRTIQYGRRAQVIVDGTELTSLPAIISGSQGNVATPTWVAAAVANFVPPTASVISLVLYAGAGINVIAAPNNNYGAQTSTSNPPPAQISSNTPNMTFEFVLESTNVYYAASGTAGLLCLGWEDNI